MLKVEGLGVRYGETVAVDGVDLAVSIGEVVALLGPSGCGKTSVLRAVAGLEPPAAGRVLLDGVDVTGVPPHRRGVGLMFQDYALFPHRDVAANVAFGLRMRGDARTAADVRVAEVLAMVGLGGYERRRVDQLSGGEQQRVALARALAPAPSLLMLDEPLGSLDRTLRDRLAGELRELFSRLDVSTVYVTHDQAEAFTVADRVVVMKAGRVVQEGRPPDVWRRPADVFVARFLGFTNLVLVDVAAGVADSPWGPVPVADAADGEAVLVIRPDGLRLGKGPVAGEVVTTAFQGDHFLVTVQTDAGPTVQADVPAESVPAVGDRVTFAIDPAAVTTVPPEPPPDPPEPPPDPPDPPADPRSIASASKSRQ
ncbi:MAG: ABC transporter ATP-binding protein [Acidimicrobiales bacterium]